MSLSVSFTTEFDRVSNTIVLTDTTDYAAQGFLLGVNTTIYGYIKVTYDTGSGTVTVYNGWPSPPPPPFVSSDVENVGPTIQYNTTINLPLTTQGLPIPAQYKVEYIVYAIIGLASFNDTAVNIYDYNLVDPHICIETSVNCFNSALQSTDDTNYEITNGNVQTIVRQHTLYPPPASGLMQMGPVNQVNLIYTNIYTGTWTAEVISTVTYLMNDGLIVTAQYSGVKEFTVSCDTSLSEILCCLINLQKEYNALECKNAIKAAIFKTSKLDPVLQHLVMFLAAQSAGNQSKMACEYEALVKVSGCGKDCGCEDSTPQIVTPAGSAATYVVDSPSGNIVVTTTIAGNITTFSLDLSPAILAQLSSLGNITVSTNTPAFITINQTGLAPNINYAVDFNPASITANLNIIEKRIVIDPTINVAGNYLAFTVNNLITQGPKFRNASDHVLQLGVNSIPNTINDEAIFKIYDFLVTPSDVFTACTNIMRFVESFSPSLGTPIFSEVYFVDNGTGTLYLRLIEPTNNSALTLGQVKQILGAAKLQIKLNIVA